MALHGTCIELVHWRVDSPVGPGPLLSVSFNQQRLAHVQHTVTHIRVASCRQLHTKLHMVAHVVGPPWGALTHKQRLLLLVLQHHAHSPALLHATGE
jgi:hypothetical protein